MLQASNNDKLAARGINEEFYLFYQVWQELLEQRTLDTYQYKVLYSLKAIEELTDVLQKNLNGVFSTYHHVEACLNETRKLVLEDVILKDHYGSLYNRLKCVLGKSNRELHEQRTLKYELTYIKKIIEEGYYGFLVKDLWESMKNKMHGRTIFLAGILASYCIDHEWSAKALIHKVNIFKGEKSLEEKWEGFVRSISCGINRDFDVLVKLYLRGDQNTTFDNIFSALEKSGVESKTREMVKEAYPFFDETKLKIGENGRYLLVNVSAHDRFSAATFALQKLSEALNMLSFFGMIEGWNVKDTILFVIEKQEESVKMIPPKTLYATYNYLDSSSKIFTATQRIFAREDMDVIKSKLNGAFGYANLSKESMFQEEKYINAWVALESLARTDMCKDIISNVLNSVPAALCQRYIYRLVRNFIEDCQRCEIDLTSFQIHLNEPSKQKIVEEMFGVMRDKTQYLALLQACGTNRLLEYRCEEIQKLAVDVKAAGRKVIQHHENVEWQLQRLYRFRNEIAHSALREKCSLLIYIEHLYDYLMTFVSEIVTCVDGRKQKDIEQVFLIIQDNYNEFKSIIDDKKSKFQMQDLMPVGIIDFI